MNQGENKTLVMLLALIAFLLLAVGYYYVIIPKGEVRTARTTSIEQIAIENKVLKNEIDNFEVVVRDEQNDYNLRKKLPKKRELDSLIHTINEVELISDSKIVSIAFNNYDEEVSQSTLGEPTEEERAELEAQNEEDAETEEVDEETEEVEETDETDENGESPEVDETKPVTPIDIALLPEELKLISLNVVLSVLDYDHLLDFLKEVEQVERVIRIDSVEFSKPGEEEMINEFPDERITVTVQLTTFYSEEVVE